MTENFEDQEPTASSEETVDTWITLNRTLGIFLVTIVVVVAVVWVYENRDSLKWDPAKALVGDSPMPGNWQAVQGVKPVTPKELQDLQRQIDENQRQIQESIRGIGAGNRGFTGK